MDWLGVRCEDYLAALSSPEHIKQCIAITGEVAADVIDILSRENSVSNQPGTLGETHE